MKNEKLLSLLKIRDLDILYFNSLKRILLPKNLQESIQQKYINLLKHYSFRIFLRDLIIKKDKIENAKYQFNSTFQKIFRIYLKQFSYKKIV